MVDDSVLVTLDNIQVNEHLNYVERLLAILDRKKMALCNKVVPFFKV